MIAKLEQEGQDDVTQKQWCIYEQHTNEDKKSRKEYDISQLEAKILRTEKDKANKEQTQQSLKELLDMFKEATDDRALESGEYSKAKSDDEMAISLLADAIAALSSYG